MSKEFYIRLTLGVYKVSQLFPEREPLKTDLRELADEILSGLLCNNYKKCSKNIGLIQELFDSAEDRGLADPRNFLVLRREYARVAKLIEGKNIGTGKTVENSSGNGRGKGRQEAILTIIKTNNKLKIGDLTKSFPGVNRRTILRDLDVFCQSGLIIRNGSGRGACYTIKNATL